MRRAHPDRRYFLKTASLLSTAAALPLSTILSACKMGEVNTEPAAMKELAAKLKQQGVYTAADPRDWAGKQGTHVPVPTTMSGFIEVKTPHPQGPVDKPGHYISTHFLEGKDGTVFDMEMFIRQDNDGVTSVLAVPDGYTGVVKV